MPTALASQLASQASQNAQILLDRSRTRGKHASVQSYLFASGRDASEYDLDSIFALGRSGFEALAMLNPRLSIYEENLFSYHARNVDRTLLAAEAVRELNMALEGCLQELGAYLLEAAASKVLEWLVRRFRVNEFNVRALVALFLPYHETQNWGKMLTILHLDKEPMFKFLVPHQKQAQKPTSQADLVLPRKALVQAMLRNGDIARLVVRLLGEALKGHKDGSFSGGKLFRTLVAFWAATMHDFVLAHGSHGAKGMSEGTSALVFAAVIEPLSAIPKFKSKPNSKIGKGKRYDNVERDTILTSYILLATISSQAPCSLTPPALKVIISSMVNAAAPGTGISAQQLVKTLVAFCGTQNELLDSEVSADMLDRMFAVPEFLQEIVTAFGSWDGAEKVLAPFSAILVERLNSTDTDQASGALLTLETILVSVLPPPTSFTRHVTSLLLRSSCRSSFISASVRSLLSVLHQRYPEILKYARNNLQGADHIEKIDLTKIDELVSSLYLGSVTSKSPSKLRDALLASSNADTSVRLSGVRSLLDLLQTADADVDLKSISEALLARVVDSDIEVIEALYDHSNGGRSFFDVVISTKDNATQYLELVCSVLFPAPPHPGSPASDATKPPKRPVVRAHLAFIVNNLASANPDWDINWSNDVFHRLIFPYLLYSKPRGKTADAVWDILGEAKNSHAWIAGCAEAISSVGEGEEAERLQTLNAILGGRIASNIRSSQNNDSDCMEVISKLTDPNSHVKLLALLIIRELLKNSDTTIHFATRIVNAISRQKHFQQLPEMEEDELEDTLTTKLAAQVVNKPNSRTTESLLYVAILSDIAALQPSGTEMGAVNWVHPESKPDPYASLLQQLYLFANTTMGFGSPQARIHVIRTLFANLGGEVGVFLSSIWLRFCCKSDTKDEDLSTLGSFALYHLAAFLQAHTITPPAGEVVVDFQILVPMVVIALSSSVQEVRKAAVECLSTLTVLSVGENNKRKKFDVVYAFDRVYGNERAEAELQYLSPDDLAAYVSTLSGIKDHFLADGDYIGAWHAEQLASADDNQEKESIKYRTHILCYLLSHANALDILPKPQIDLLQIITPCFVAAQQRSLSTAKSVSRTKRKAQPEITAALLLLPFLYAVVATDQNGISDKTSKVGKGWKSSSVTNAAKLATKIVFGHPGIFNSDDAEYKGNKPWTLLCGMLAKSFGGDDTLAALRLVLLECTTKMWNSKSTDLRKDQRVELVYVVIEAAVAADSKGQMDDETISVKSLLGTLLGSSINEQAYIIITVLDKYSKALGEIVEGDELALGPKLKKARVEPSQTDRAVELSTEERTGPFQRLAILAEVLASLSVTSVANSTTKSETLPHSFDLITHLLESLSQVVRFHASGASINSSSSVEFICQNIMASIDSVAAGVRDPPNLSPTPIRLDVLVEIIRVSVNPQTLHQALLLIAGLARLAPESVLRNVMPVFTFMGVGAAAMAGGGSKAGIEIGGGMSMLSRDDGYGWGIVQKTVDSIVPVMVSSLKESHPSGGLDMYIGARDFLRVFTDAANHIPRHRRTNFFSHLVTVLGPKDFLAPVCLFLIEKSANKIVRSQQYLLGAKNKGKGKEKDIDAQSALALPTALVHHFEPWIQVLVLAEMLRESERLLGWAISPSDAEKTLLDDSSLEEHSVSPAVVFRRRAQAIITFVGFAAKTFPASTTPKPQNNTDAMDDAQAPPQDSSNLSDVVSILIALSTKNTSGGSSEAKIEDIATSARLSLTRVLSVMSAVDFIDTVLLMLSNNDHLIQEGALSLFSTRLPRIAVSVRQGPVSVSILKICGIVHKILLSHQPNHSTTPTTTTTITNSAFNAIRAIGSTLCSGEESAVTALVPLLVGAVNVKSNPEIIVSAAIRALITLPSKLGPRLIPYLRDIVSRAVNVLREGSEGLTEDTVQLLHDLLTAIPTFWSTTELTHVIKLYLDHCGDGATAKSPAVQAVSNFMRFLAKKAPSKVLVPTLCDIWRSLQIAPNAGALVGYFDLVKRSLRSAARPEIQENLRPLFNIFLSAFGVVKDSGTEPGTASASTISAFVELVVKLNEPTFRPLFRRLYDWAFAGESDINTKIMFYRVYIGLVDYFKSLMNPYMTILLPPSIEILKSCTNVTEMDDGNNLGLLLPPVLETLTKSLACDDGSFWRDDKIAQLSPLIIAQIPVCIKLNISEAKTLLQECIVAGAETVGDDSVLKAMNLDILMHTRSEDVKTRLFALTCTETLWRANGSKLLGFVAEAATFIAECCEDENDLVTREALKLKDAVESVAGSISGL
ncbi:armadillo-type protein [Lentinula aff. lateritia]|uniref:Armadillo-type protein n=1 Tax=Lentinula aff. lateritia TaxID=2804960 RepID=A0ACC1TRI7_9AGAR|nr:armadillo-type protein [Lentinula aff. lateritia]